VVRCLNLVVGFCGERFLMLKVLIVSLCWFVGCVILCCSLLFMRVGIEVILSLKFEKE